MSTQLLENLTESQQQAVKHKDGPLLVLAGPGSGKTRVITHRIGMLIESGVKPWHICAITFTNKAAEEMRNRVVNMGLPDGAQLSTFHSLCVRLLRSYASRIGIKSNFSIYDMDDQKRAMKSALKALEISGSNFSPSRMLEAVSKCKNRLVGPKEVQERADDYFSKTVGKVYNKYQQILSQNNSMDFDDLLMQTAFMLRNDKDIRDELNGRFRYLLVDEYQDTNHAQYQIARGLAMNHGNICVTGDPDQSIYRWRGADIQNILAFEKDWPDATVIRLQENFRSTPQILKIADALISHNQQRKAKALIATIDDGPEVQIVNSEDETDEAEGIADRIRGAIDAGEDPREIAVFYRVNSMSRVIEEALIRRQIPYQIVRGVEFYGRKEIRDMLAYLKVLVNPDDTVALLRIINTPTRGIGKTTLDRMSAYCDRYGGTLFDAARNVDQVETLSNSAKSKVAAFVAMIEQLRGEIDGPVAGLMENIFEHTGLYKMYSENPEKGESAIENVDELINTARNFDESVEQPRLVDYLQTIALYSDADAYDSSSSRVALMTLHAAKGLEFDRVFAIGLEDGLLPHEMNSYSSEQIEEERRLFFVGITRARKELCISFTSHRTVRGLFLRSIPSQFLYEIGFEPASALSSLPELTYDDSSAQVPNFGRTEKASKKKSSSALKSDDGFTVNQLVKHKKFGLGRVKQYVNMGADSIVVVKFNSGQTRSLMLKYAKLEIVNQ